MGNKYSNQEYWWDSFTFDSFALFAYAFVTTFTLTIYIIVRARTRRYNWKEILSLYILSFALSVCVVNAPSNIALIVITSFVIHLATIMKLNEST